MSIRVDELVAQVTALTARVEAIEAMPPIRAERDFAASRATAAANAAAQDTERKLELARRSATALRAAEQLDPHLRITMTPRPPDARRADWPTMLTLYGETKANLGRRREMRVAVDSPLVLSEDMWEALAVTNANLPPLIERGVLVATPMTAADIVAMQAAR